MRCARPFSSLPPAAPLPCPPPAGTVIPAQDSVYAAASVGGFKQRTSPPSSSQGAFMVGPLSGQPLGSAASVQLVNRAGTVVAST